MSLGPIALRSDFAKQSPENRERTIALLNALHDMRLTCRVEVSGRELQVIVARGLPPAQYWLRAFTEHGEET